MKFPKHILMATTAICLIASNAYSAQNELNSNTIEGATITSNTDNSGGESINMQDSGVEVFNADGDVATTVSNAANVVIQVDTDNGGAGNFQVIDFNGGAASVTTIQSDAQTTTIQSANGNSAVVGDAGVSLNGSNGGGVSINGGATGTSVTGAGGFTTTGGVANINTTGTANTNIGNSTGTTTITGAATLTGGTAHINASSNNNTNINTGTSTGTVTIGNSASTTNIVGTANINNTGAGTTNISRGTGNTNIGNTTGTTAVTGTTTITSANGFGSATFNNTGTSIIADDDAVSGNGRGTIGVTQNSASMLVTNSAGNSHGLQVGTTNTVLSGGVNSTTLTLDDSGATFANTTTGGPATVTGVADGVNGFDAVNVRQLNSVKQDINDVEGGVASTAAMANIPYLDTGKRYALGMGFGNFKGSSAFAVGGSTRIADKAVVKASLGASDNDATVGIGAGFSW